MNIDFEIPFVFHLEVVEVDDHIPAVKTLLQIKIQQFLHQFCYEGTVWIECLVWDKFVQALHKSSYEEASFNDMNGNFALVLKQQSELMWLLIWKFTKLDITGTHQMNVEFTSTLDADGLAKIREQFDDFPVWW